MAENELQARVDALEARIDQLEAQVTQVAIQTVPSSIEAALAAGSPGDQETWPCVFDGQTGRWRRRNPLTNEWGEDCKPTHSDMVAVWAEGAAAAVKSNGTA